jgi:hypothetical protein
MSITNPQNLHRDILKIKSLDGVKARLKEERDYLEHNYNTINSLKNGFTVYRNYLRQNIETVENKPNDLLDVCLHELRLTTEQQKEFSRNKHSDIKQNKSNLRLIYNVEDYIEKNLEMISKDSMFDKILGLAGLTGRRTSEIGCTAVINKVDDYTALFRGQLKTKNRVDVVPYNITLLCKYSLVNKTLKEIRSSFSRYIDDPAKFHSCCSSKLSRNVKRHYVDLFEQTPKAKDLRAIYATICFRKFNEKLENKHIDRYVYYSKILGHSEEDITTCGSYVDFYIL